MDTRILVYTFVVLAALFLVGGIAFFALGDIVFGILFHLVFLFYALPQVAAIFFYEKSLGRFETRPPFRKYVEDYKGLMVKEVSFKSNRNQTLRGYVYLAEGETPTNLLIVSHGLGGGGHNSYMDAINFFAHDGFVVFAYDSTGTDKSEGRGMEGLPQGFIDLSFAIDYVRSQPALSSYKISLFGHSFGAYSVLTVLNLRKGINAVCSVAGFNDSISMIRHHGREALGRFIVPASFYVKLYEKIKYGPYAKLTALEGIRNSDARIMVMYSKDDTTVPKKYGYDIYYDEFKDDPRVEFVSLEDKGHEYIYHTVASKLYTEQFFSDYYDYAKDRKISDFERDAYMQEHFDRAKGFELDSAMLSKISAFLK